MGEQITGGNANKAAWPRPQDLTRLVGNLFLFAAREAACWDNAELDDAI